MGSVEAKHQLFICYYDGIRTNKNVVLAMKYLEEAVAASYECAKTIGRDEVKFIISWNGFRVYKIVMPILPGLHIGGPPFILVGEDGLALQPSTNSLI